MNFSGCCAYVDANGIFRSASRGNFFTNFLNSFPLRIAVQNQTQQINKKEQIGIKSITFITCPIHCPEMGQFLMFAYYLLVNRETEFSEKWLTHFDFGG